MATSSRQGTPRIQQNRRLTPPNPVLGWQVMAFREKESLRQEDLLALLAPLGWAPQSVTTLSRIERGESYPSLDFINAMARLDYQLGHGRGRSYWGWGEIGDSTEIRRPAPALDLSAFQEPTWAPVVPPTRRKRP